MAKSVNQRSVKSKLHVQLFEISSTEVTCKLRIMSLLCKDFSSLYQSLNKGQVSRNVSSRYYRLYVPKQAPLRSEVVPSLCSGHYSLQDYT
jgi:hypothetical protein